MLILGEKMANSILLRTLRSLVVGKSSHTGKNIEELILLNHQGVMQLISSELEDPSFRANCESQY